MSISDEELNEALLRGGETFRTQVIRDLERWSSQPAGPWREQSLLLLRNVWPRQLSVRSASVTEQFVKFAVSSSDRFMEVVEAISPLCVKLPRQSTALISIKSKTDLDPSTLLTLIYTVLSELASGWPYQADQIVQNLAKLPELARDLRMVELRVRLASG